MVCLMTGQGGGQGVCRKGRGLHCAEAVSHAVRHERHESQAVPAEVVGELQTVFPGRFVVLVGLPGICIFAVVPEGASVLVEGLVEGHDEVQVVDADRRAYRGCIHLIHASGGGSGTPVIVVVGTVGVEGPVDLLFLGAAFHRAVVHGFFAIFRPDTVWGEPDVSGGFSHSGGVDEASRQGEVGFEFHPFLVERGFLGLVHLAEVGGEVKLDQLDGIGVQPEFRGVLRIRWFPVRILCSGGQEAQCAEGEQEGKCEMVGMFHCLLCLWMVVVRCLSPVRPASSSGGSSLLPAG